MTAPHAETTTRAETTLRQTLTLLGRHRLLLAGVLGTAVLVVLTEGVALGIVLAVLGASTGLSVVQDVGFLGRWIAAFEAMPAQERVLLAAALLVLLTAARGVVQFGQALLSGRLQAAVEMDLRTRIVDQWHAVRLDYLQQQKGGAWVAVFSQYVTQLGRLFTSSAQTVAGLVVVLAYGAVAFALSWQLTVLAIVMAVISGLLLRPLMTRAVRSPARRMRNELREMQALAVETMAAMRTIHLFRRESWSVDRFRRSLAYYYSLYDRSNAITGSTGPIFATVNMLFVAVLMVAGMWLLPGTDEARLAQVALFLVIALRVMGPISNLGQLQAQWTLASPSLEAIFDFLRTDDKPYIEDGERPFAGLREGVALDNVTFTYPASNTPALRNVTITIARGQSVGVAGVSGAGKSTVIHLIARMYDPDDGRVLVDGVDLRDVRQSTWRARIAVVTQDLFLFHDTVEANLRFARPDATFAEIEEAARRAQAHDFILSLPDGYQTMVQDRGMRLSGGQRQRLAVARALLVDADLLILDEATNELDSQTEAALQEALEQYRAGRTVLVIAHRLSTIARADAIYVLEQGQVVEVGRHSELLARRGYYRRLFDAQQMDAVPVGEAEVMRPTP